MHMSNPWHVDLGKQPAEDHWLEPYAVLILLLKVVVPRAAVEGWAASMWDC